MPHMYNVNLHKSVIIPYVMIITHTHLFAVFAWCNIM